MPQIYGRETDFDWQKGFWQLADGDDICLVSTGSMTHKALKVSQEVRKTNKNIGVIDVFMLKPVDENLLFDALRKYKTVITLEEAFINKGGLDCLVSNIITKRNADIRLKRFGFEDNYVFKSGGREFLAETNNFGEKDIINAVI